MSARSKQKTAGSKNEPQRDEGSALTMVLAFIVISSLIIVPMLNYAITVLRVNSVSVEKREALETVRGGARVAVADPVRLFKDCASETVSFDLTNPAIDATTTCIQLEEIGVVGNLDIPHAAVAMQVGEPVPAFPYSGLSFKGPEAATAENWWDVAGTYSADPTDGTIWLPPLPERESTVQNPAGHALPAPYNCQVYFPGTYEAPVVVAGPTYFTSGVYYFEESVTVVGGADAVVGFGLAEGCVGDLQAVLDLPSVDAPDRFNIDGLGATWIFGDDARLIVDDTKALSGAVVVANSANVPLRFEMNQRYIQNADEGGARVSIMSVNGRTDTLSAVVGPLDVPGVIHMPESVVRIGGDPTPVSASSKGFVPSTETVGPRQPDPPTITSMTRLAEPRLHDDQDGAALVEWAAPVGGESGGSTITGYEVFETSAPAPPGAPISRCVTTGALQCVVTNLESRTSNTTSTFVVVATNALGTSDPSAPANVTPTGSSTGSSPDTPRLAVSQSPTNVVVAQAVNDPILPADWQWASVSWDAPEQWPAAFRDPVYSEAWFSAPVSRYDVEVELVHLDPLGNEVVDPYPGGCFSEPFHAQPAPTTCLVKDLEPRDPSTGNGPEYQAAIPFAPAVLDSTGLIVITPEQPFVPAVNGTWVGYRFNVTATNPIRTTHESSSPLFVSSAAAPSLAEPFFNGSGTAPAPKPADVLPIAPPYVPDPLLDINVSSGAVSTVTVDGYVSVPQGRISVVNPSGDVVEVTGGTVAGSYWIDAPTLGGVTKVGFENTVLQRKIAITTTNGSGRESVMIVQVNANGADVKVNAWITQ